MCCKADFSSLRKKIKVTKYRLGSGEGKKKRNYPRNWDLELETKDVGFLLY